MTHKSRICCLVTSQQFVRNYLETRAFEDLAKEFHLSLLIPSNLKVSQLDVKLFSEVKVFDPEFRSRIALLLFDLNMLRKKRTNSSFAFRTKFRYRSSFKDVSSGSVTAAIRFKLANWLRTRTTFLFHTFLASRLIFPVITAILTRLFIKFCLIDKRFEFENFDLVIIPSSAYDLLHLNALVTAKKKCIETLLLVDNWDNLSSKSVLWTKPDWIGTWGEQSTSHAIEIQEMPPNRCFSIGTPRFDSYLEASELEKRPIEEKYILFLGSFRPYGEHEALTKISFMLTQESQNWKIIYKPHPLARWNQLIEAPSNVLFYTENGLSNWGSQKVKDQALLWPSTETFPALIRNSEFVIVGLTSMIIEASILKKPAIVLAFEEPNNLSNPAERLREQLHFKGIDSLPNIVIAKSMNELDRFTHDWIKSAPEIVSISTQLNYFINLGPSPYRLKLLTLVKHIYSQNSSRHYSLS